MSTHITLVLQQLSNKCTILSYRHLDLLSNRCTAVVLEFDFVLALLLAVTVVVHRTGKCTPYECVKCTENEMKMGTSCTVFYTFCTFVFGYCLVNIKYQVLANILQHHYVKTKVNKLR